MEGFIEPTALLGLFTLIILEIILGIDNLIFIAILADKLPPDQSNKARTIGLGLALIIRIALLWAIAWLAAITDPFLTLNGKPFSLRDLILIAGGGFLLFKSTLELHERIEAHNPNNPSRSQSNIYSSFWKIILQIVVLDLVFSLDSVITAIGMANDLSIMVSAVIIAVIVMMFASKHLAKFINEHPTLIILCLGLLFMVGFSLIAEGFGFAIPKGYLYTAIVFSATIEILNQMIRPRTKKKI